VSVIIPAYNAETTLAECIEACLAQTYPDTEVIVVDDGSTDATSRIARGFPVHYVRQDNRGPAAARNRGAVVAKGAVLAFTDADCVPEPDWLERLLGRFKEGVVAVGGTYGIANPEAPLAKMIHAEIALRHDRFEADIDFLGSFNVAYRREAFDAVGGFDERFSRASAEDNDLAYRLHDAGGRLVLVKDAVVRHYHPARMGPYLLTQMRHGYWRMKLYAKHPGRARGDTYAGPGDLIAPPLSLVASALGPILVAWAVWGGTALSWACGCLALAVLAYLWVRVPLAYRVGRASGSRAVRFLEMAYLRDVARAAGMLAGLWAFGLGQRGQA